MDAGAVRKAEVQNGGGSLLSLWPAAHPHSHLHSSFRFSQRFPKTLWPSAKVMLPTVSVSLPPTIALAKIASRHARGNAPFRRRRLARWRTRAPARTVGTTLHARKLTCRTAKTTRCATFFWKGAAALIVLDCRFVKTLWAIARTPGERAARAGPEAKAQAEAAAAEEEAQVAARVGAARAPKKKGAAVVRCRARLWRPTFRSLPLPLLRAPFYVGGAIAAI